MILKCAIIEDEPASQDVLINYIEKIPNLELLKVFSNAINANSSEELKQSDLIYLDINMPLLSGIDFLKSVNNPPLTIITSAYPEYALEGFELDVVDYLLKPFSFERFFKATNKAFDKFERRINQYKESFIILKADKKIHQIKIDDIYYLEAIGDYVKVYFNDKYLINHSTLSNLLTKLPDNIFVRIHKSHAINLNRIEFIEGNRVKIKDKIVPVGLKYKDELLNKLSSG